MIPEQIDKGGDAARARQSGADHRLHVNYGRDRRHDVLKEMPQSSHEEY